MGAQTVTAELTFNHERELVDFISDDRLRDSRDGKSFLRQRWSTPVRNYTLTFIDAGSTAPFKELNPADIISQSVGSIKNYDVPAIVQEDYMRAYSGDRFAQSVAYVQSYPSDLEALAPRLPSLTTPVQILVGRDDP